MDKNSAVQLIKEVFQNPFNKERFIFFVRNLLNHFTEAPFIYRGNFIPDAYDSYIKTLERIGKYEDPGGNKIDILIVNLKKEKSLEHARTMQRNFIAWYLNGSRGGIQKDAALVAFVSPKKDDWRFSLVKMEYKLTETQKGRIKAKEELTPAKRLSFLVGEHESSHTAQSRLVPILEDDVNNPTLKQLEESFSIEKVTKEFFEKYRELFLRVKENLDEIISKDKRVKDDFKNKEISTTDFAKKLLGQIVFLYFLQKKGWFGVERDADWGTGPKSFLRLLFERKITDYKNLFNDILEPLFYEALAVERTDDFYSRFNCKVPFLNGGLFDPIKNYDWIHTDILLPNKLFSDDIKTKEGDIGTGILDIFDRYNFTVKEDEPLEKEVAVDPEMLGKVFENLLEVKDRKSKGTYYTPREIVHYMCQQSLINYLASELKDKVKKEDIETLIKYGESAVEHDAVYIEKTLKNSKYKGKYDKAKLPKSIEKNVKFIDEELVLIRVCDPAVGSGAFLVGMMNEIIRTRNALTPYFKSKKDRTTYNFKRHAIQNCLYGVDIDPGAVEIAKLRLWLSLVVDEEDIKQIKPLPNLDYKIMQGNSLLEEYQGIKFIDERFFKKQESQDEIIKRLQERQSKLQREYISLHSKKQLTAIKKIELEKGLSQINKEIKNYQTEPGDQYDPIGLFGISDKQKKANQLLEMQKQFFSTASKNEKDKLKEKIEKLTWELIAATLRDQGEEDKLKEIIQFQKTNIRPFFLWRLHFAEVFQEKDGFDVVIANPPYVRISGISKEEDELIRSLFKSVFGHYDLYIPFMEKGINLLNSKGTLAYITPNKYLIKRYANKLRPYILEKCSILWLIDTSKARTFDTASVYPVITILSNQKSNQATKIVILDDKTFENFFHNNFSNTYLLQQNEFEKNKNYIFDISIGPSDRGLFEKILTGSEPLGSISRILTGTPAIEKFYKWDKLIFQEEKLPQKAKGLKFINVSNVKRYKISWGKKIRTVGKSLEKPYILFDKNLIGEHKWNVFKKKKIVIKGTAKELTAAYDNVGYANVSLYAVVFNENHSSKDKTYYYLALLNSKLINYWYCKKFASANLAGNYISFNGIYLEQIPIKQTTEKQQKPLINLVDKILAITKSADYFDNSKKQAKVREYEKQIDRLVYKLYGLTKEEIKIVEF